MDLVELPGRPVPEGVRAGTITTSDGVALRYARWDATSTARKGTVVVCQGRSEFIEKYFEVIDELRSRGFGVLAFDWRGQGGSGRLLSEIRKGHVRRFSDYQIDLETIMSVVALPDCRPPFYALGHSMGGSILIETAHEGRTWFDRMVLTAPMISLAQVAFPAPLRTMLTALSLVGFGRSLIPGGSLKPTSKKPFEGNPVTSDEQRYRQAAAYSDIDPRLGLGAPTISWLREALKVTVRFASPFYAEEIRQPMLIIASAKDGLVSTPKVEAFGRRLKGGHTVVIPDARHEVMMERDALRAEFWGAFDAFVPGEQPFL